MSTFLILSSPHHYSVVSCLCIALAWFKFYIIVDFLILICLLHWTVNSITAMTFSTFCSPSYLYSVGQETYMINLPVSKWRVNNCLEKVWYPLKFKRTACGELLSHNWPPNLRQWYLLFSKKIIIWKYIHTYTSKNMLPRWKLVRNKYRSALWEMSKTPKHNRSG